MKAFCMAVTMFSVFPAPQVWDETKRKEMLLWFPAVGLLIGAVWYLAAFLLEKTGLAFLTAAILTVLPWFLSGSIHLDGYLDCADAFFSRADREKQLQILKDSRVGSFALIAMTVLALVTFAAFLEPETGSRGGRLLVFIPVVSRTAAAFLVLFRVPMQGSSYEKLSGAGRKEKTVLLLIFLLTLSAAFLFCGRSGLVLIAEALLSLLTARKLISSFGGMNGDISGCSIMVSECSAVVVLALLKGGLFV